MVDTVLDLFAELIEFFSGQILIICRLQEM
jgi:hypothetical protein